MTIEVLLQRIGVSIELMPWAKAAVVVLGNLLVFVVARYVIARGLTYIAERTRNKYDDILVARLRPFRFAWIAPLTLTYFFADLLPESAEFIRQSALLLILWLTVITVNSLLNAFNAIYEASPWYRGQSIQGYLDLGKIIVLGAAIILTISLLTRTSPLVLLSGLGAVMALVILVFRDTLLSFVASLQIRSNDLVREGDWIEMPAFGADGSVTNIALHTVSIQNWDKTITVVPTYKLMDTPYKNWRGMEESGGRRIKRAIFIDLNTVRFCDAEMLSRFAKLHLVRDYVAQWASGNGDIGGGADLSVDDLLARPRPTNVGVFQAYATSYLKSRRDLHVGDMPLLVRQLEPGPGGLPIEVYAFAKTTDWEEYESIQASIVEHLVAAAPLFGLRIFQQPSGVDFRAFTERDVEALTTAS